MTIDLELTNHCNARCSFCPRDATPHQGLMTPRIFAKALERAFDFRVSLRRTTDDDDARIVFCGTGEPLLNPNVVDFVRRTTQAGFESTMSTNGARLDPVTASALLDAGLGTIVVNASELDDEYERIYRLPFARTRENIEALVAADRCSVWVSVVDHTDDPEQVERVMGYWRRLGVTRFLRYGLINRGGALTVDGMDFCVMPEVDEARRLFASRGLDPVCVAPFVHLFVGFDGRYYLCSSDWRKEVPLGSVFDTSFAAETARRMEHVRTRAPICKRCSLDPLNRLAAGLRAARADGGDRADLEALVDEIARLDHRGRAIARETAAMANAVDDRAERARTVPAVRYAELVGWKARSA